MTRCDSHAAPVPCSFCAWASSGNGRMAGMAALRARQVSAGLTGPAPRHEPALPRDYRFRSSALARASSRPGLPRAILVGPSLQVGGAETHGLCLVRETSDRVNWVGAVAIGDMVDPGLVKEYEKFVPVGRGPDSARYAWELADVAVLWAVHVPVLSEGSANKPKVVQVVHSPGGCVWSKDVYTSGAGVDGWVWVSPVCEGNAPEGVRPQVIPNAPDMRRLARTKTRAEKRAEWGVPEGAKVAGFLQRFSGEKGCDAMTDLARADPSLWVVAVGDGQLRKPVMRKAKKEGLRNLICPGRDLNAGDVLGAFDCLVHAAEIDCHSLTVTEAWSLGVPVVSTPEGAGRVYPDAVTTLPHKWSGAQLLGAVREAMSGSDAAKARIARGLELTAGELSMASFGKAWGDLIVRHGEARRGEVGNHIADAGKKGPTPGLARQRAVQKLAKECPHRYKDSCGCEEPYRCRDRGGERVTEADCAVCLEGRGVPLPP